jgi:hypothetical protein
MVQNDGAAAPLPPLTLADLMQALNVTEANIRWWEGNGTLPKAERDPDGKLLWDVRDIQEWAHTEKGQEFIRRHA